MRLTRLLVVSAAVCAALPAQAFAGWKMDRTAAIARIVWHHPCVDRMEIRMVPLEAIAQAYPQDEPDYIPELAYPNPFCVVLVANGPRLPQPEWDFEPFCTLVLHGSGHLAGMSHSRNEASIMYPRTFIEPAIVDFRPVYEGTDRRCRKRGRPFLEKHDALAPRP